MKNLLKLNGIVLGTALFLTPTLVQAQLVPTFRQLTKSTLNKAIHNNQSIYYKSATIFNFSSPELLNPAVKKPLAQRLAINNNLSRFSDPKTFDSFFTSFLIDNKLTTPAADFYGLFKQVVYAHTKNKQVMKNIPLHYYAQVADAANQLSAIEKSQGYAQLKKTLREAPASLSAFVGVPNRPLLAFYAGEELNVVLSTMEQLKTKKKQFQQMPEQWASMNILSLFLPPSARTSFYKAITEQDLEAARWIAQHPRMSGQTAEQLNQFFSSYGRLARPTLSFPGTATRISQRQKEMDRLLKVQTRIRSSVPYLKEKMEKTLIQQFIIRDASADFGLQNTEKLDAQVLQNTQKWKKQQALLTKTDSKIKQIQAEIDFLQKRQPLQK